MKTTRNIALGILGFGAWMTIAISGDHIRERETDLIPEHIIYLYLLIAAVIYFHWLFRVFVLPISGLPLPERAALLDRSKQKYRSGFFRGTIGFGYFLLAVYVLGFLIDTPRRAETPNFALGSIFFIGLGTLAQARGLVLALISPELDSQHKAGIQPKAAPIGDPPAPVESSSAAGEPPSVG